MRLSKFNSKPINKMIPRTVMALVVIGLLVAMAANGMCDTVTPATARLVAEHQLRFHVERYGHWNHSTTPAIANVQEVRYGEQVVAYNFPISPSGHVLVAVDDVFSPVLLYSTLSSFNSGRSRTSTAIESWIVPELDHQVSALALMRSSSADSARSGVVSTAGRRIRNAWVWYTGKSSVDDQMASQRSLASSSSNVDRGDRTQVGPLLTTMWGQGAPYNAMTPAHTSTPELSCDHTLTGCVATAWAQLLRYWRWPDRGTGHLEYVWNEQTLAVDFDTADLYDWDNMPVEVTADSSQVQKEAVSLLMYHMGLAAEMVYGCDISSSAMYADQVLPLYFKFKPDLSYYDRASSSMSDDQWFAHFKNELDADPPRPVVLAIFSDAGGHEVIADGYQIDTTDWVHINFGWDGSYSGYYNITYNFEAYYSWEANSQVIVTGIEPDNAPPVIEMAADLQVAEGAQVLLSAQVNDPEQMGPVTYRWTQTSGAAVTLADADAVAPTFTAPLVNNDTTQLVFQLRATDTNRAYALDSVAVSVVNTDNSSPPPSSQSSGGGGGGGGGCFMMSLWP